MKKVVDTYICPNGHEISVGSLIAESETEFEEARSKLPIPYGFDRERNICSKQFECGECGIRRFAIILSLQQDD